LESSSLKPEAQDSSLPPIRGATIQLRPEGSRDLWLVTRTDREGGFAIELPSIDSTNLQVDVAADGFLPSSLRLRIDRLPSILYLQRNFPSGSITGIVRDSATAEPLSEATVSLKEIGGTRTKTGANGIFRLVIEGSHPSDVSWTLIAEHDGYSQANISPVALEGSYEIALYRSIEIKGTVRDERGIPLGGSQITLIRCLHTPRHETGIKRIAVRSEMQSVPTNATTTNADGTYRLTFPLTPTDSFLTAEATGYVRAASTCVINHFGLRGHPQDIQYDFTLHGGITITGRVQDAEGKSIQDALLWFIPPVKDPSWHAGGITARTDKTGAFKVGGLAAVAYTLTVDPPIQNSEGFLSETLQVNPSDGAFVVVTLQSGRKYKVRVRIVGNSEGDNPVHIAIYPSHPSGHADKVPSTIILNGATESAILNVDGGVHYLIAVSPSGLWAQHGPFTVEAINPPELVVSLKPGARLIASIVDRTGAPIDAEDLRLEWWSEFPQRWVPLTFVDSNLAPAHQAGQSAGKFRASVPAGRIRMSLSGKTLQETNCTEGREHDAGQIVVDR
jgi:hypothetical protein